MNLVHLPWLEISILIPLAGAAWVQRIRRADLARESSLVFAGLALATALLAWLDFEWFGHGPGHSASLLVLFDHPLLTVDGLSAPLLPLTALMWFLTLLSTSRTKVRRFSFARTLVSESILIATFGCQDPWGIIALLGLSVVPIYVELRFRRRPTRIFQTHMVLFLMLLVGGEGLATLAPDSPEATAVAAAALFAAIFIRNGVVPFHGWVSDLLEHATFGTSLLFSTPIVGAYAAIRLALPLASDGFLSIVAMLSLITAVYASGLALVQTDLRRFFCYLYLSQSALVMVGIASVNPISMTGALCTWLSISLALGGLGLTLRALESRCGRVSMSEHQGLYEHTPNLATFFMLTGLACVGFPGTFGFVGAELLVDGVVESHPHVGVAVVIAAAFNGIALLRAFFLLFTGRLFPASVSLKIRTRERYAVLALAALIIVGGLFPQANIAARHQTSLDLLEHRGSSHPR